MSRYSWRAAQAVALVICALAIAACGGSDDDSSSDTAGSGAKLTKVRLQLQWFTQAQFAGYIAAAEKGYYKDAGLDVEIMEGGTDIVPADAACAGPGRLRDRVGAQGAAVA